ncbi:hypothetical protein [Hathewaya limosa]|uniref:Uncharacterized protein n=1 Tax=Hathewaya limosa TaxID=1536 RepID=A0ABU0JR03_HATLI|nr:hypothetical protein [Hathewaya limosa]MDQ0479527.1 hypothetical protein [Hathewaya limosa]
MILVIDCECILVLASVIISLNQGKVKAFFIFKNKLRQTLGRKSYETK